MFQDVDGEKQTVSQRNVQWIAFEWSYLGPVDMERGTLQDRNTLPTRVKDTVVLHAKYEHGRGTLPSSVT